MVLIGLLGFALLVSSLLMGLWLDHVRERPVYARPTFLIHPAVRRAWTPARWILLAVGGILLGTVSPPAAIGLAILLAGLGCWKRYLRSRHHRHHMFRQAFDRERARDPAASDAQILQRILYSLHARWGEELIEQIVIDNPTPEGVADMVIRMEQGVLPPGFNPARMLRGDR